MSPIRPVTEADWPQVWSIIQQTLTAGETYAMPADLSPEQGRDFWLETSPGQTVVWADEDGAVLGTAKMGPNRPAQGAHIGTGSFMVSPDARGRGVGRALGEYVVRWHRENGYHGIQFNAVVESNEVAVRLWKSLGFNVIGTVPDAFRHPSLGLVGLHVMYLPLAD